MVDAQAAMGSLDEGMRLAGEQQRRYKGLKDRQVLHVGRWSVRRAAPFGEGPEGRGGAGGEGGSHVAEELEREEDGEGG